VSQVLAIVWLRRRLLMNRLRRGEGVWDLVGTILLGVLWGVVAVGAAIGLGAVMLPAARAGDESLLFKLQVGVIAAAFFAGTVLPLLVEKETGEVVTERLLVFPLTPARLFWIAQAALALSVDHLFYLPALLVVAAAAVLGAGSVSAGLAVVLAVWLGVLAWGQAVQLGTEVLLRGRRSREALAVVVLVLILAMGMGPGLVGEYLDHHPLADGAVLRQGVTAALAVGRSLAPWQAASALQAARTGETGTWLINLGGTTLWLMAGLLVSRWFFLRFYLGDRGRAKGAGPDRAVVGKSFRPVEWRLEVGWIPPETVANAVKDLRIILRSLTGRMLLILTPAIMGFMGWSVLADITEPYRGLGPDQLRFYGMFFSISLITQGLNNNILAFERGGVQGYFLLPGRLPWVLLGKNLGLWIYQFLILAICLVAILIVGTRIEGMILVTGSLVFIVMAVYRALIGNLLSCLFPVPRTMSSRRTRQSAMGNLLSFVAVFLFLPLVWLCAALPSLLGDPKWGLWGVSILLAVTLGLYFASLGPVAALLSERRERILMALSKGDK